MPVIFVIIDEFAQMSQILKETKGSGVGSDYAMKLENILREGRAIGFKFIFSSQTYSDGVEGLTESARKQIQQRLAMKNTPLEIKDTLALSSDSISPAIQNAMNTLPPYESLFKWLERTTDGKVSLRVEHLRNMYAEDSEVDIVADKIASSIRPVKSIQADNNVYVEKSPVLIDGAIPKTFASQIPFYKKYESPEVLEELDDEDVLVYAGVPSSFNLARPFVVTSGTSENILVVSGNREYEMSVILSVFNSFRRKKVPIEIWANEKNSMYKRYKNSFFSSMNTTTDLSEICSNIVQIKEDIQSKKYEEKLVLVLGYERMTSDMEVLGSGVEAPKPQANTLEEPEDMSTVLLKIKACSDPAEKKKIRDDYNARVAQYQAQANQAQPQDVVYDARKDMEWIVKRASINGTHFIFAFEEAKDFMDSKLDPKAFQHKLVFAMAKDDALNIVGNRRANELGAGYCAYTDGKSFYSLKPHLYKGVPCNGWEVNDQGQVIQRG